MKVHLNDYVKVKLTDHGKDIYYHQFDLFNAVSFPTIAVPEILNIDEEGKAHFQLWEFMLIFGKYIWMGGKPVIDPLELEFDNRRK